MGNFNKKAKAKVDVELDSTIVLQGEMLNGKINITPNKGSDITSLQNPQILFALLQEQNWQSYIFSEEEKACKSSQSNNSFYGNQTLNCSQYKNKNFSDGISIPFQYKIPDNITPSLEYPHSRLEFAYIRNFLTINIPELSYKNKILLIIQKKPSIMKIPLKVSKVEERKKFILFGSGSILIEGSYPKYSFPILGNIPLTVRVDASKSDVLIKDVTVKLKRKLQFFSKAKLNSVRTILENMYEEKKTVCSKSEDLLFNIPFKDSNEIEYNLKCTPLGENTQICCLIPNVDTNTMNVFYYIKIIADPDDLLAKKIELKMPIDFHSKDDYTENRSVYDNFNNQLHKINSGECDINYLDPYLNNQNNYGYFDKRGSQSVWSHQHSLTMQNEFNLPPNNQNPNQNQYNGQNNYNNNYNGNPYESNYCPPPPPNPNEYQNQNINNINNNSNNKYPSYEENFNNNKQENNSNQNQMAFPKPPQEEGNDGPDLPTLDELEKQSNYNEAKEKEQENKKVVEYPDL
jgi:hypothetical protein